MKFLDKLDKEVIYNFYIYPIYRKHHFHHDIINMIETAQQTDNT